MASVFISYAREDTTFVHDLHDALQRHDRETWVDWEGIPFADKWEDTIKAAIDDSDTFVFVISPDSAVSEVCQEEINHAVESRKRIIPVVRHELERPGLPKAIAELNWIFMRPDDEFEAGVGGKYIAVATNSTASVLDVSNWKAVARGIGSRIAEPISALSMSPDGKLLATAFKNVHVWGIHEGRPLRTLRGKGADLSGETRALTFSPGGKYIAAARRESVQVWRVADGKQVAEFPDGKQEERDAEGAVTVLQFSPDGRSLAAGTAMNVVRLWDTRTWRHKTRVVHDGRVVGITFSLDSVYFATITAAGDNTARVWKTLSGESIARLRHEGEIIALAFGPEYHLATASADGSARLWADGREVSRIIHNGHVTNVVSSPNGRFLATGSDDRTAGVWRVQDQPDGAYVQRGSVTKFVFSESGPIRGTALLERGAVHWNADSQESAAVDITTDRQNSVMSPFGEYAATGGKGVTVWRTSTGQRLIQVDNEVEIDWNEVRRIITATHGKEVSHRVMRWELDNLERKGSVEPLAINRGGRYLITTRADGITKIWDLKDGKEIAELAGDKTHAVAFSEDGDTCVLLTGQTLTMWDLPGRRQIAQWNIKYKVRQITAHPDGLPVVVVGDDGVVRRYESADEQGIVIPQDEKIESAHFGTRGQYLVTTTKGGIRHVVDPTAGKDLFGGDSPITAVAFHPHGSSMVIGLKDGSVQVWDTQRRRVTARFSREYAVSAVALALDGQLVAAAGDDGTATVWEIGSSHSLAVIEHGGSISDLAFSADRRWLATTGKTGVRVWRMDAEALIEAACSRLTRNLSKAEWRRYIGDDEPYRQTCLSIIPNSGE